MAGAGPSNAPRFEITKVTEPRELKRRHSTVEAAEVIDSRESKRPRERTSPAAPTGAVSPFWTANSAELSRALWLPAVNDCLASVLTSWNGLGVDMVAPTDPPTTSSVPVATTEGVAVPPAEPLKFIYRLRNVKLRPTTEQKRLLRLYDQHARYTYNAVVAAVNSGEKLNKIALRDKFVIANRRDGQENPWIAERPWIKETPKAIREQAVFEAVKNFKAAFTNKAKGNIEKFKMGFKKRGRHGSQRSWTIGIGKAVAADEKGLKILPRTIGHVRHYGSLPFDKTPDAECGIRRDERGCYFLSVPIKVIPKAPCPPDRIVALDPGVRKFATGYSPTENNGFYAGRKTCSRIAVIIASIDLVNSQLALASSCTQRRRLRKKKIRLYADYKNVRDDFHWKLANMLTTRYDKVLLPHLETAKLSRGLKAKASRVMLAQSHGLFSTRLAEKCAERGVTFVAPSERHTSKTCGCCGMLVNVGSSETFACRHCDYVADRDLNAARNIYIRTETFTES